MLPQNSPPPVWIWMLCAAGTVIKCISHGGKYQSKLEGWRHCVTSKLCPLCLEYQMICSIFSKCYKKMMGRTKSITNFSGVVRLWDLVNLPPGQSLNMGSPEWEAGDLAGDLTVRHERSTSAAYCTFCKAARCSPPRQSQWSSRGSWGWQGM